MTDQQYVSLVAQGGTPIRLTDQRGAPYPTTGYGSLVFANGATLENATLENATFTGSLVFAQSVPNITSLKSLANRPAWVTTEGYFTAGDGGGGPTWLWVQGSTATADDFMVVRPNSGTAGRYVRQLQTGAAVSPKWAGCGLGSTDDTTRFQVVVNYGLPVDVSGGTFPIRNITISSSGCPGIFSDGSGKITPASGSNSNTILLSITRDDFYVDRVFFEMPISVNPNVAPACNRAVYLRNGTSTQSRLRVTNSRFVGGSFHVFVDGGASVDVFVTDNISTGSWQEAIIIGVPVGGFICRNTIHDGGYVVNGPSGAIRVAGISVMNAPAQGLLIDSNIIHNWAEGSGVTQEAIDISGQSLRAVTISNNIMYEVNGGVEAKTGPSSLSPHIYGDFLICNNNIRLKSTYGLGIDVHFNNSGIAQGIAANIKISDNLIYCNDTPSTSVTGIIVTGYDDISISGNQMRNVFEGIRLSGEGLLAQRRTFVSGNDIQAAGVNSRALVLGSATTLSGITVQSNRFVAAGRTIQSANPTVTGFELIDNYVESSADHAMELRGVSGRIVGNTFITTASALLTQVTPNTLDLVGNTVIAGANAFILDVGGTYTVVNNTVTVPAANRVYSGTGTVAASGNIRGFVSADPTGTNGGSLGDVFLVSPPTSGGFTGWVCTVAGGVGVAVWKGYAAIS